MDDYAYLTKKEAAIFMGIDHRVIGELMAEAFFVPEGLTTERTTKVLLRAVSKREQTKSAIAEQIASEGGSL